MKTCPAVIEVAKACPMPAEMDLTCRQAEEEKGGAASFVLGVVGGLAIIGVLLGALFYNEPEGGACLWPPCDD